MRARWVLNERCKVGEGGYSRKSDLETDRLTWQIVLLIRGCNEVSDVGLLYARGLRPKVFRSEGMDEIEGAIFKAILLTWQVVFVVFAVFPVRLHAIVLGLRTDSRNGTDEGRGCVAEGKDSGDVLHRDVGVVNSNRG